MFRLGVTKGGHPRHPLYVAADAALAPWGGSQASSTNATTDDAEVSNPARRKLFTGRPRVWHPQARSTQAHQGGTGDSDDGLRDNHVVGARALARAA